MAFGIFRVVLQQNARFSEMEEKYKSLHGKTSSLFDMEEKVMKVSQKVSLHCCVFEWNFLTGLIHNSSQHLPLVACVW